MQDKMKSSKYTSAIKKKLILVSFLASVFYLGILLALNLFILHWYWFVATLLAFLIASLPFLSFAAFLIKNQDDENFVDKLANCKYNPYFPFYIRSNVVPQMGPRINIGEIKQYINKCDVVLRRSDNYLGGLIFSQNSYFTHAGIIYIDQDNDSPKVLHSEGKKGVHISSLEDFLKCDDVAILRFSFDKNHDNLTMRQCIIDDCEEVPEEQEIKKLELDVFDILIHDKRKKKAKSISYFNDQYTKVYADIILKRALSLKDTPYDFEFDFHNFDSLSCIEYVWYCFKCLFPYHQIKVRDFEFFEIFKLPVIVPDIFIKNRSFRYVYTSLPKVHNKRQLKRYVKGGDNKFWLFLFSILVWELALAGLLSLIYNLF